MLKRNLEFKDKHGLVSVEVEIRKRGNAREFTCSAEVGNSLGQCLDRIKPINKYQEKLIELWKKYNLNTMHAGTEKQEKALENCEADTFEGKKRYLMMNDLLIDDDYEYGSDWKVRELPKDFEKTVNHICDKIEELEADRISGQLKVSRANEKHPELLLDLSYKQIALALHLDLTVYDAKEITDDGYYLEFGHNFIVGTYDELHERAHEYLTDDPELWRQAVENEQTTLGLEDWAEWVLDVDGIGHVLGYYDGMPHEYYVNPADENYLVIRQ